MFNELTRIIEEGKLYINSKIYIDNCYIINSNWLKKWIIYYNNSIKYNNIGEIYHPGNIANLDICNKYSFTDDPKKIYIINETFKYKLISSELWNSFKNHYAYDKEIKFNELYVKDNHTNYLVLRLLNENYFYYYKDSNSLNENKILNDFKEHLKNFNNSKLKLIHNKNFQLKKIENNFFEGLFTENKILVKEIKREGLTGLINLGATCFMNATLQLFSNIKELKDYLYNKEYIKDLNITHSNGDITKALSNVIENLYLDNGNHPFKPTLFKSIIGKKNPKFLRNEPNDSRELIQYIIDTIHEELNLNQGKEYTENVEIDYNSLQEQFNYEKYSFEFENNSIISKLFYGIQGIETLCLKCNSVFYSFDHFSILSLPIIKRNNYQIKLTEMLDDFEKEIDMTGNNKFYCTNCNRERNAKTRTMLFELPKYLIIHPAFNYRQTNELYFEILPSINFAPFLYSRNNSNYELIAAISHLRSNVLGHNVTFCKKNNIWYCFNDSLVSEISFEDIKINGTPLILLYTKS